MKREVTVNLRQGALQRHPVVLNRDIKHVLELRALLGEQRTALLTENEHPLAAGLKLAPKWLTTRRLTQDEELAFQQTALFAKTFCEMRSAWDGHRKRMARDLLNADQCQARMFELHVIRYALRGKVGHIEWFPWRRGPDIVTSDPGLQIECKLILSEDLKRLFQKVTDARNQRQAGNVPFVVAVGFRDEFPSEPKEALLKLFEERAKEIIAPDVSATLFFLPLEAGGRSRFLGVRTLSVQYGAIWEAPNPVAINPLPAGFGFGSRPQSTIGRDTVGQSTTR